MKTFKEFLAESRFVDHREHATYNLMHPTFAATLRHGQLTDYYEPERGDKHEGIVTKLTRDVVHIKNHKSKKTHKFKIGALSD